MSQTIEIKSGEIIWVCKDVPDEFPADVFQKLFEKFVNEDMTEHELETFFVTHNVSKEHQAKMAVILNKAIHGIVDAQEIRKRRKLFG